jgi:serine phosphatase RsbU (regulator of sigma subunit)
MAAFERVWRDSPTGVVVTRGTDHRLIYQNQSAVDLLGLLPLGSPVRQALPQVTALGLERLNSVLRTGETVRTEAHRLPITDVHDRPIFMRYVMAPLGDPPWAVVTMGENVTAHVHTKRALERTTLLADLAQRMITAQDPATALQQLTDALVRDLVDLAAVYIFPENAVEPDAPPLPPDVLSLSKRLAGLGEPPRTGDRSAANAEQWRAVLREGRPLLIPLSVHAMPAVTDDPDAMAWLTAAGLTHLVAVPLVVAGTLSAMLVTGSRAEDLEVTEDDLPFWVDVAARAATGIDALRASRQQRNIAAQLQQALLPPSPPPIDGLDVAGLYIAGSPNVEVGGDWWHVLDLGGGKVAAGIGDVSGRGLAAASVMGQVSAAMRAGGVAQLSPGPLLALLDTVLRDVVAGVDRDAMSPQFATACYAVLDRAGGSVVAANAGHLPLLVRQHDRRVKRFETPPGTPLGLGMGDYREVRYPLAPGDTLVLYTDGLVESRTEALEVGLQRLSRLLGAAPTTCADDIAEYLVSGMDRRQGHGPDDVALLVLRCEPPSQETSSRDRGR